MKNPDTGNLKFKFETKKDNNIYKTLITEKMLEKASITVNKNTIPNDPESPFVTSGIRIGTAAITTRGFSKDDLDYNMEF